MLFRVSSRFSEAKGERCPRCGDSFVDFMDLGNSTLACYGCGVVFVPKHIRTPELLGKKVQLLKQREEEKKAKEKVGMFQCPDCPKACKTARALGSHRRIHRK